MSETKALNCHSRDQPISCPQSPRFFCDQRYCCTWTIDFQFSSFVLYTNMTDIMVDRGRWLGNFIKSIVLGFCVPCARSRLKILLFYLCELRQQCKSDWALRVCFGCWFEVFQYLLQITDIFRTVLPIENVCVQSFGHIK